MPNIGGFLFWIQNMMIIYKLTAPNGKIYVGQTKDIQARFNRYRVAAIKHQIKIYRSIKKYGWENFNKEVLEYTDEIFADEMERYYITKYNCCGKNGLNLDSGGRNNKKHSDETKEKIRISITGRKHSEETKRKQSIMKLGKKHSEKTIQKMIGRKHTIETKLKISVAHKNKHHSEETKNKIKSSLAGHEVSPETKEKLRQKALQQWKKQR